MTTKEIVELLERDGPRTGAELLALTRLEPLPLWRLCRGCVEIHFEMIGRRFLRFDRAVEGYARLSPSVRREFLTYTVLGLAGQQSAIATRAQQLKAETERISRLKSSVARESMATIVAKLGLREAAMAKVTFIIAGDVTYGMSHAVPRPEPSTGQMVRGSDLDVIVVATDDFPEDSLRELDEAIYRMKHFLLVHPDHHEEIDYVIKRLAKVRAQLRFDTFEHMVASKILHEGQMLCGSTEVFATIKDLVKAQGVPEKLAVLEARAAADRRAAEAHLLASSADTQTGEPIKLFYTREERDEIY